VGTPEYPFAHVVEREAAGGLALALVRCRCWFARPVCLIGTVEASRSMPAPWPGWGRLGGTVGIWVRSVVGGEFGVLAPGRPHPWVWGVAPGWAERMASRAVGVGESRVAADVFDDR
jgi:hypothetical protein